MTEVYPKTKTEDLFFSFHVGFQEKSRYQVLVLESEAVLLYWRAHPEIGEQSLRNRKPINLKWEYFTHIFFRRRGRPPNPPVRTVPVHTL